MKRESLELPVPGHTMFLLEYRSYRPVLPYLISVVRILYFALFKYTSQYTVRCWLPLVTQKVMTAVNIILGYNYRHVKEIPDNEMLGVKLSSYMSARCPKTTTPMSCPSMYKNVEKAFIHRSEHTRSH